MNTFTNINSLLKKAIIAGLFLIIALTPLIVGSTVKNQAEPKYEHYYSCGICVGNSFFPYITARNFYFRIIIEIVFALWIILILRDKNYLPKKSWVLWAVTALIGILILSTLNSANPYKSFWSNYERMEGLIGFFHLFAYLCRPV